MTVKRPRRISQPDELLRALGTQPIPVEPSEREVGRRDKVVGAIAREIRASAARKVRAERFRKLSFIAAAAAFVLAVGVTWNLTTSSSTATAKLDVAEIRGTVVLVNAQERKIVTRADELSLRAGEEIQTSADGEARLQTRKSTLQLGAASRLTTSSVASSAGEERLRLALGRVDVSVDKNVDTERKVVIETPNADVMVRGTKFSVDVHPTDRTATVTNVKVTHGVVWILVKGNKVATLNAGQQWSSATESAPAVPKLESPEPSAQRKPQTQESSSVDAEPSRASASSNQKLAPADTRPGTLAEENQLFRGALDARNRGDDARAVELFEKLLARFPRSALGEEAQVERFRALKRLGRTQQAAAGARRYLAVYKSGFARDEARNLALGAQR